MDYTFSCFCQIHFLHLINLFFGNVLKRFRRFLNNFNTAKPDNHLRKITNSLFKLSLHIRFPHCIAIFITYLGFAQSRQVIKIATQCGKHAFTPPFSVSGLSLNLPTVLPTCTLFCFQPQNKIQTVSFIANSGVSNYLRDYAHGQKQYW